MAESAEWADAEQEARGPAMQQLIALMKVDDATSAASAGGAASSCFSTVPGPDGGDAPLMWKPVFGRGVYGGQIFAQSLLAAWATVAADYSLHAAQAHFLLRVRPDAHVLYRVLHVRDGATYCIRSVTGSQGGAPVFTCLASFQRSSEPHTHALAWSAPEGTPPATSLPSLSEPASGMHVRYCRHVSDAATASQPSQRVWLRTRAPLRSGGLSSHAVHVRDDQLRLLALAYMSDIAILSTAVLPFGYPRVPMHMMATLSHSLYVHAADLQHVQPEQQWLLYDLEAPALSRSRGFALGRIHDQSGRLLASTVQEGVVRLAVDDDDGRPTPAVRAPLQHNFARAVTFSPVVAMHAGDDAAQRARL